MYEQNGSSIDQEKEKNNLLIRSCSDDVLEIITPEFDKRKQ